MAIKKDPEGSNLLTGAPDGFWLQPIFNVIAQEFVNLPIEEMFCCA